MIKRLIEKLKNRFSRAPKDPFENTAGSSVSASENIKNIDTKTSILRKPQSSTRAPFEGTYIYLFAALSGLMAADLALIMYRDQFLPTSPPPLGLKKPVQVPVPTMYDYKVVSDRNIFNADGVIPKALSKDEEGAPGDGQKSPDGPATLSSLPLNLVGTIVHANPAKSVATIEVRSGASKILPYFPNDAIESLAVLIKVERKKAIFRNTQTNRLEYIQIKDDSTLNFKQQAVAAPAHTGGENTEFTVKRADLNNYMKNLPELLQQATAIPNIIPGTGGKVDGFKIIDIAPNSVYEKLGIKKNDVIKGVNGDLVDSPAKAMELYNTLKTSNRISLEVERNGSKVDMSYTIE